MNQAQFKLILVFALFAIIGFGPISPGCLLGFYVIWRRPAWFWRLIQALYDDCHSAQSVASPSIWLRIKVFMALLVLFIIDILPVPITPMLAFILIFSRPVGLYRLVARIYQ